MGFARDFSQIYDLTLKNLKTGCQWRQLPKDFPQWQTVYSFFKRKQDSWKKIMDTIVQWLNFMEKSSKLCSDRFQISRNSQ